MSFNITINDAFTGKMILLLTIQGCLQSMLDESSANAVDCIGVNAKGLRNLFVRSGWPFLRFVCLKQNPGMRNFSSCSFAFRDQLCQLFLFFTCQFYNILLHSRFSLNKAQSIRYLWIYRQNQNTYINYVDRLLLYFRVTNMICKY